LILCLAGDHGDRTAEDSRGEQRSSQGKIRSNQAASQESPGAPQKELGAAQEAHGKLTQPAVSFYFLDDLSLAIADW